jgi:hypothetical protein
MKGIRTIMVALGMASLGAMPSLVTELVAQPKPGDLFKEYVWTTHDVNGTEKHFRVGGKLDYRNTPENFNEQIGEDGWIKFPYILDLKKARRAEIQIEKNLCHDGTKGLAINFNDNGWLTFPESDSIPSPQWQYLHHTYPAVSIPLHTLKTTYNTFMLKVDPEQEWDWPQNLVYGIILRIYYDKEVYRPSVKWRSPRPRRAIPEKTVLEITSATDKITNVDFIANYEDVNYEGDGVYQKWHYHYYCGKMIHHIGSNSEAPWKVTWDTEWVPDQSKPISIGAIITLIDEYKFFVRPVTDLQVERDYSVRLYKPYEQPAKWTTRADVFTEKVKIDRNPEEAIACQLIWTSWSPCYCNGIYVNDRVMFTREGPCYDYFIHRVRIRNISCFIKGENVISTGKTPLDHEGNMVHGMDVQWPGIMVLMKFKK